MHFLITGTDTGVGKTTVISGLLKAARAAGLSWVGMKPFCTGDQTDIDRIEAVTKTRRELINQVWFAAPLAPYAAALVEDRSFDLELVREAFGELSRQAETVLVEGAGGLLVPILDRYHFGDLAQELGLELVIVAANRLGALNHSLLTLESAHRRKLNVRCLVLNEITEPEETDLAKRTNGPILTDLSGIEVVSLSYFATDFKPLLDALRR